MAKAKVKFYKKDLIKELHSFNGGSLAQSERVVDFIFDTLTKRIDNGNQVLISGFGSFLKNGYKQRNGRNPRTGEMVIVPAQFRVKFKSADNLKKIINQAK